MKRNLLLTLLFVLLTTLGFSQTDKFWSGNNESRNHIITSKAVARLSFPTAFKLFNLNIEPLRQELFTVVDNHSRHSTIITLPNADGNIEQFEVVEASNFEPALQAQFPEIRAFSGKGITDKYATLKLSISSQGIQTLVFRTDKENEFIEAYSQDHTVYAVFKSQRKPGQLPWTCSTEDKKLAADINSQVSGTGITARSTGDLKTMRLAQSVTAEYSNYFGATSAAQVSLVLAAINATLTRCNGAYEKDLAIHLNLIAASTNVIYYDAATDPYSDAAVGTASANANNSNGWNYQLQNTLNSTLGGSLAASNALYDIGHLFGASGGGGNAGCIGCICVDPTGNNQAQKGSGYTSPADGIPEGDNFDIDYVVHEVGHQLGANHTFTFSSEGGTVANSVQKEIGSGITIMGYAGITSQDVAPHSIDIYHETSIAQIQANLATKTCPVTTVIAANNATPVIAPVSNYTIPKSTPFVLTGSATDDNPGDVLTYCWEQNDATTTLTGASSIASVTKATGPNWLSFSPSASPIRTCPILATILAGGFTTGPLPGGDAGINIEALSSVARTLNFRLTVRDNHVYSSTAPVTVGQTNFTDMVVTVSAASGPFGVSSPNSAVSWQGLSSHAITWTVNNTTAAPVSCANVNILLSTDGGLTWPTTLAANTANDGSEVVTIPNNPTTTARIKVEAVGNIFFDISNTNFTITLAAPGFDFDSPAPTTISCGGPTSAAVTLGTVSYFSYATPINLSSSGVPAGATISYSINPLVPGNSTIVTLNNTNTLSAGTYDITITGVSGSITKTQVITYVIQPGTGPSIITQPSNVSVCNGANATFTVTTSGTVISYQWQISTDDGNSYTDIIGATSSSYIISPTTYAQNGNRYKVVITGQCNSVTSNQVTLIVNPVSPAPVITPANSTICLGDIATLTAASTTSVVGKIGTGILISTGNSTTSSLAPNPLQNFYGGSKQQMVFRTSELTSLGMINGSSISAIILNLATADPTLPLQNFVVKMKNSTTTTMSAWETGLTTVRTASSYSPVVGSNTLTLTTPFVWTGNNLIVEINYSNANTGTAGSIFNTAKYSTTTFVSTRFYRIDNGTAVAVDAYTGTTASTTFSISQRNNVIFNFNFPSNITWSPLTNLYTNASATTAYTGTILPTVYAMPATAGTFNFTALANSSFGCSSSSPTVLTVNDCASTITVNLKLFLQGYYMGGNTMQPVLINESVPAALASQTDMITVELHHPTTFALIDTKQAMLSTDGSVSATFTQPAGSYYIAIKHRNTIQTWSADPVACSASTALYNFTTAASKAFGNNMILVDLDVWAFYTGDINQDEFIDGNDFSEYDNDSFNSVAGEYKATDLNGDGFVDGNDFSVYDNNSFNSVTSIHP